MRPQIAFVNNDNKIYSYAAKLLKNNVDFEEIQVTGLSKFFKLFDQDDFRIKLVVFDIDCLESELYTDVFEILNTVDTLSKINHITPVPQISVNVHANTSVDVVRNLMSTNIKGLFYDFNDVSRIDEHCTAIRQLLDCKLYVAKELNDKVKPQRKSVTTKNLSKVNGIALTLRQEQILNLICTRGSSNKSIARILNLSESTVKLHIGAILKKYGLKNRTQLALFTQNHYNKPKP